MNSILAELLAAPAYANEAVLMESRLSELAAGGKLTWEAAQKMEPEIADAAKAGWEAIQQINAARKALLSADAQASAKVPVGF